MTGYDGRGAQFPLTIPRGSDVAFTVTATDSNSAAIDLGTATITGNIYTTAGTVAVAMTDSVGGAGSNVITLSLSDTQTTALTSTAYRWSLTVVRGADTRYWLAGAVTMVDASAGRTSNGANATLVVDEDINVLVTVAAVGGTGGAGTIRVEDEGVSVVAAATALNFAGAGVTVTDAGSDEALVTISSGGSGANLAWVAASSQVTSDSGTDATLTVADGTNPGLMSSAHYTKLNTIDADITTFSLPANTTISAYGATLVDDADAATARSTLGLGNAATLTVDADLATFAVPASTTISTFGASLVDDADAATARTTLGLGTAATTAATAYATAAQGTTADGAIQKSLVDAKGDLLTGTANDTPARLAVGVTNGHVLTVDSGEATGLKWAAAAGGAGLHQSPAIGNSVESWGVPGVVGMASNSSQGLVSESVLYSPIVVTETITITSVAVQVTVAGTASGTLRLSLYEANDAWQPGALVADWGTVAHDSTGVKSITSLTTSLSPGNYLTRIHADASASAPSLGYFLGGVVGICNITDVSGGIQLMRRLSVTYAAAENPAANPWNNVPGASGSPTSTAAFQRHCMLMKWTR